MINGALSPHYKEGLVSAMKQEPFVLVIDGSSDNGIEKMKPLSVRFFDVNTRWVVTEFLNICLTTGKTASTADIILSKLEEALALNQVPWENYFGIAMDDASVNMDGYNSFKSRVLQKNSTTYVMGCPWRIVHNMADKASQAFGAASGFDVEDFCVDLYYWFDKSTQRKSTLIDCYDFYDLEYRRA